MSRASNSGEFQGRRRLLLVVMACACAALMPSQAIRPRIKTRMQPPGPRFPGPRLLATSPGPLSTPAQVRGWRTGRKVQFTME